MLIHWDVYSVGNNRGQDPVDPAHVSSSCCIWSTSSPALAIFQSLQSVVLLRANIYDVDSTSFILMVRVTWYLKIKMFTMLQHVPQIPSFFLTPACQPRQKPNMAARPYFVFFQQAWQQEQHLKGWFFFKTKTCRKPEDSAVVLSSGTPPSPTIHQISTLPVKRSWFETLRKLKKIWWFQAPQTQAIPNLWSKSSPETQKLKLKRRLEAQLTAVPSGRWQRSLHSEICANWKSKTESTEIWAVPCSPQIYHNQSLLCLNHIQKSWNIQINRWQLGTFFSILLHPKESRNAKYTEIVWKIHYHHHEKLWKYMENIWEKIWLLVSFRCQVTRLDRLSIPSRPKANTSLGHCAKMQLGSKAPMPPDCTKLAKPFTKSSSTMVLVLGCFGHAKWDCRTQVLN